jgi:2-succinyl-5-enolpyruvyl-6-hydroxy-3-cyclohexene-1-carboxylate synthase
VSPRSNRDRHARLRPSRAQAINSGALNAEFCSRLVADLLSQGVHDVCISPGSRSGPLAIAFARDPSVRHFVMVDERSSGFFSLGLAKRTGRPVAIVCTSGTATAELAPAAYEAGNSDTPLLLLTADRPPELHQIGANQTIEQRGIYGSAVRWSFDPGCPRDGPESRASWHRMAERAVAEALGARPGPVHLNLPFREPLLPPAPEWPAPVAAVPASLATPAPPSGEAVARLHQELRQASRPLVFCGGMPAGERLNSALSQLVRRRGAVVLAEPTSQLRRRSMPGLVPSYDLLAASVPELLPRPDLVLMIGEPPTSKSLSSWLSGLSPRTIRLAPVWKDPSLLASVQLPGDPAALLRGATAGLLSSAESGWSERWQSLDEAATQAVAASLSTTPLYEAQAVRALASVLPPHSTLVVASSLAVREVDSHWPAGRPSWTLLANRGASGIDGTISTAAGAAAGAPRDKTVVLLGDLALYHDMNGLWALGRHGLPLLVVVLDNGGGAIFNRLAPVEFSDVFEELFATPVGLDHAAVAALYGLDFERIDALRQLPAAIRRGLRSGRPGLLSVAFSAASSAEGNRVVVSAVGAAVRRLIASSE